jgi:beta-mannosidase
VISAYDRQRFYWPSSPSIGWGSKESMLQGDSHYWGVWWGMEPFEIYKQKTGRFMSEYGFQGMPPYTSFLKIAPPDSLYLNSSFVKNHQKHPAGYQTIQTYMERDYKIPVDFKDYLYVSQLLQAEGIKTAIESHRRAKPTCMGSLYWQLNDCWPVTSWSSSDYYNNWKALHYFVKKAYDEILVSVDKKDDIYNTYIISDKLTDISGKLSITILDFQGKILSEKQVPLLVKKNSSNICYSFTEEFIKKLNKKQILLKCSFIEESKGRTYDCIYYFAKVKELILEKPEISIKKMDDFHIEISTNVLAKNVYLYCEGKDYLFSDNFFDLLPGEKRIITAETKGVKELIKFKTLADCYPQTEKKNKP